jgi:hypothetical protein
MDQLKKMAVKLWLRYVDDVFAIINNKDQADAILDFLRNQHVNIKFTIEHEKEDKLPFLDVVIIRQVDKYTTSIYHKPTFTGVYLNWTSLSAFIYIVGMIRCHAERIWRICSDYGDRISKIEKLKGILYKNDYPANVVETTVSKILERKASPSPFKETEIRKKRYLKLPYVCNKCDGFALELKKHVERFFNSEKC